MLLTEARSPIWKSCGIARAKDAVVRRDVREKPMVTECRMGWLRWKVEMLFNVRNGDGKASFYVFKAQSIIFTLPLCAGKHREFLW